MENKKESTSYVTLEQLKIEVREKNKVIKRLDNLLDEKTAIIKELENRLYRFHIIFRGLGLLIHS